MARATWNGAVIAAEPSPATTHIRGHVAFWRGVQVER